MNRKNKQYQYQIESLWKNIYEKFYNNSKDDHRVNIAHQSSSHYKITGKGVVEVDMGKVFITRDDIREAIKRKAKESQHITK